MGESGASEWNLWETGSAQCQEALSKAEDFKDEMT